MRFYDETFGLGTIFFDATDEYAIATALKDAESQADANSGSGCRIRPIWRNSTWAAPRRRFGTWCVNMSDLKFRVGIFLGYAPEQGIIDHGIGRLLGFLITGVRSRSASAESIAIACPGWYIPQVRELLADLRIPEDAVKIVTTDGVPYILRLRALLRRLGRGPTARVAICNQMGRCACRNRLQARRILARHDQHGLVPCAGPPAVSSPA